MSLTCIQGHSNKSSPNFGDGHLSKEIIVKGVSIVDMDCMSVCSS